jgi:hypothetical protein
MVDIWVLDLNDFFPGAKDDGGFGEDRSVNVDRFDGASFWWFDFRNFIELNEADYSELLVKKVLNWLR